MIDEFYFDVVICGGGLAGLTLARQLKLELPELTVAVVDRLTRPLPEAAFKVGESSIELGTYYFGKVLKLEEYFRDYHLPKLGLRFFIGDSLKPIEERPEVGISLYPPIPSYQIDRGRLENDLRQIVVSMGVTLFEGAVTEDIHLSNNSEPHTIKCRQKNDKTGFLLSAHWVIDALGRRRLLQNKLGLTRSNGHQASAAWWRYKGRVDIEDIASGKNAARWHSKTIEDRYFSTNHLTDKGYWVWLIPLGSDATSVGIVTDETIHPQKTYGQSYQSALNWLQAHEPALWQYIRGREPIDFLSLKNYSYGSAQIFSLQRWSCVGEAAFFLDPLYSLGSDFIALGNTITTELIRREIAGELNGEDVAQFNRLVLDILYQIGLGFYQGTYGTLGHPQIYTSKLIWDTALLWAFHHSLFFQGTIKHPMEEVLSIGEKYRDLNSRVQTLFSNWAHSAPPRPIYIMGDMTRMRFMQLLHLELLTTRTPEQVLEVLHKNLDRFEELAQVFFWQAVEESYPELSISKKRPWINAWRIVLDPTLWSEHGLFEPTSAPRSLAPLRKNFTGIFAPQSFVETVFYDFPYNLAHWRKGFLEYHLVPIIIKHAISGKSAMWIRKIFSKDYPS